MDLVKKELDSRHDLEQRILALVLARCEVGTGFRVKRGVLHQYIYHQLGFIGAPDKYFAKYLNTLLAEQGFRVSYLDGFKCIYGLRFKGEPDWRHPSAEDLRGAYVG